MGVLGGGGGGLVLTLGSMLAFRVGFYGIKYKSIIIGGAEKLYFYI